LQKKHLLPENSTRASRQVTL
jgi:rplS_bact: ribosomal protein L19